MNSQNDKHKVIIALLTLFLIGFCLFSLNKYLANQNQPVQPPITTGARIDKVEYQKYLNKSEEFVALKDKLPYQISDFVLDFDYGLNRFTVTPINPANFDPENFSTWLKDQQYRYLSEDDFMIKL